MEVVLLLKIFFQKFLQTFLKETFKIFLRKAVKKKLKERKDLDSGISKKNSDLLLDVVDDVV